MGEIVDHPPINVPFRADRDEGGHSAKPTTPDMVRNCLGTWFPVLERAYIPVPRTIILRTDVPLGVFLEMEADEEQASPYFDGLDAFIASLRRAVEDMGTPAFLRTGQTSGKHSWCDTCYLPDADHNTVASHVGELLEYSAMASIIGLPTGVWAVREFLPTAPAFILPGYGDMPVTRERRYFVRDEEVDAHFPYWPEKAVEGGRPDDPDWRSKLAKISEEDASEVAYLTHMSAYVGRVLTMGGIGGYWSVDWLWVPTRGWICTDLAQGEFSWRPDKD